MEGANTSKTHESTATDEEEQKIFDIPDEDDKNYGPVFTNPPAEEEEIYETLKSKNITTLHRRNIRYCTVQ